MYKNEFENVEIYFICNEEEEELIKTDYDKEKDIHYWYFNTYLSYKYWKNNFNGLHIKKMSKMLLTIAASRYIIYKLENEEYNAIEYKILT